MCGHHECHATSPGFKVVDTPQLVAAASYCFRVQIRYDTLCWCLFWGKIWTAYVQLIWDGGSSLGKEEHVRGFQAHQEFNSLCSFGCDWWLVLTAVDYIERILCRQNVWWKVQFHWSQGLQYIGRFTRSLNSGIVTLVTAAIKMFYCHENGC